jgi:tRNA (mo5U34)-methyltransferase
LLEASGTPPAPAERLLTDLLSALQAYSNADPHIPLAFENLIRIYLSTGRYEAAVQAGERYRQITREHNPQPAALARSSNNLGVAYRRFRKFEHSRRSFAEAMEHARQAGTTVESRFDALIRFNRALLELDEQHWVEAEDDLRSSLRLHEAQFGPNHGNLGDLTNNLGVLCYRVGRYDEAGSLFKRALEIWQSALGAMHPRNAVARCNLAALYRFQGFFAEAEWWFQRALRIWDKRGSQLSDARYETFFANLIEAPNPSWRPWLGPEVGLLHPIELYDDPLIIDMPDGQEQLSTYRKQVHELRAPAKRETLDQTLEKLGPWYHNLEIQPGLMTNPGIGDHPGSRWRLIESFVPKDLSGKSVLDIGCNAGYFSLQMKKRGASRVVSIDIMPYVLAQARFMSTWEGLPIEIREVDTYDVESLGTFDYVVFVGVLYHLKHPLYALEKISNVCKDTMFFQSVVRGPSGDFAPKPDYPNSEAGIFDLPEYPKLYFVEKSFNGDVSNWWFANQSCLKAMIRTAGFREIISTAGPDTFVCRK